MYKVRGELVANYDMKNRPLIYTRLKKLMETEGNLVPINKLEFNTEGLLLMTNNSLLVSLQQVPTLRAHTHTHFTIMTFIVLNSFLIYFLGVSRPSIWRAANPTWIASTRCGCTGS